MSPPLPTRPRLLPGLEVHRRDAHHLQVGLEDRAVVLPDSPDVRDLLETWRLPAQPPTSVLLALVRLDEAGLLVEAEVLDRCLQEYADGPASRAAVAASLCQDPRSAPDRWASRATALVRVDGSPADHAALARLLTPAGVGSTVVGPGRPPAADGGSELVVVVCDREPRRDQLDALLQHDVTHLVVRSDLDHVVVGPFVVPGRTACVRCLDAHLADRDPRRPLVLEQHTHLAGPAPRDPVLHQLALAWAARDLLRWCDGQQPSTWSATVRIGPSLEPERHTWLRHPHCGCGWADLPTDPRADGPADLRADPGPAGLGHQESESSLPSSERRCSREQVSQ